MIYNLRNQGLSLRKIVCELKERAIPSPTGKAAWGVEAVRRILQNEKYKGHVLLQKTYVSNFFTGKRCANNGELPKYLLEGHHEAIIKPDEFPTFWWFNGNFNHLTGVLTISRQHRRFHGSREQFHGIAVKSSPKSAKIVVFQNWTLPLNYWFTEFCGKYSKNRPPKLETCLRGTPEGTRTPNPRNRNPMLYPLSHRRICFIAWIL